MKPKEFDELIRQKFDQNDFAYKSKNWDALAEQLEGRAKKRSIIMWWWVPAVGMAASVAMAMGVTSLMRQGVPTSTSVNTEVAVNKYIQLAPVTDGQAITTQQRPVTSSHKDKLYAMTNSTISKNIQGEKNTVVFHVRINEENTVKTEQTGNEAFNFLAANANTKKDQPRKKKEDVVVSEGYNTFIPEDEVVRKKQTFSITLLGGYNQGNQNTGYMAGAAVRKMLNDKVYIENDVAFASSNNTQSTEVLQSASRSTAAKHAAAKTTNVESNKPTNAPPPLPKFDAVEDNYNLNYIQVSPSIGYKLIKKLSIAAGPDFQRALADNRPYQSTEYRGDIMVAPLFDVGFIGKTEYSITRTIKAGISYRKGINNFLTPMDKYIDRDYLQFQLRCAIFNR